ncbi:MAG: type VI secretion system Vgr family protein, partial [Alphaproteobacteria bacterium]
MNELLFSTDFIQASRTIRVHSPLGDDALLPERVAVEEEVGDLFRIEMTVRAKQDITPNALIGKLIDVELEVAAGEIGEESIYRPFNGLLTEIHAGPKASRGLRSYTFILRPQLWLLSQRTDHRIWMDQTAIDVLETLLREHGLPGPDVSGVLDTVPKLHYSVQHGESDLDDVKRRLEEFGLFWWFSHEKGQHRLHVANHPSGWLQPSDAAQGESQVRLAMGSTDRNHINSWSQRFAYIPGARAGADWNFETPRVQVKAALPSLVSLPDNAKREVYEYPSRASTIEEAEKAGKLR